MSSAHFWLTLAYMMNGQEEAARPPAGGAYRLHGDARRALAGNSNHLDWLDESAICG